LPYLGERSGVDQRMRIAILTPIRLIGEGIAASLRACEAGFDPQVVCEVAQLRALVASVAPPRLAIVDVTQNLPLDPIRRFHFDVPDLPLLALGVHEQDAEIIAHGSAGFIGYLRREDGLEQLRARVDDAVSGRLLCSPEIAAGIMRGLFLRGAQGPAPRAVELTLRESQVAELVSRGLSNKEIARALELSESTVKHHVHSILGKIGVPSRFQLVRDARQEAWPPAPLRALA
jgi:two-component system, NarL family, nitrate/nitrite response regulator NarL